MCARVVNPYNLDDDDDATFLGLLSSGLIWITEDEDDEDKGMEYIDDWYKKIHELKGHKERINDIVVTGDYIISASSDQTLRVWSWKTGKLLHTMTHKNPVFGIVIRDESVIASSREEINVWNWKTGKLLYTFGEQTHFTGAMASDGDLLAIASMGDIQIWNWRTGKLQNTLTGRHRNVITTITINENMLLSYSIDKLLLRNWENNEIIRLIDVSSLTNNDMKSISLNGDFAILADEAGIIGIWNWKTGAYLSPNSKDIEQIYKKIFAHPLGIYIYNPNKKWQFYHCDSESWGFEDEHVFTLTEDYTHLIMGYDDEKLDVYKVNLPLDNSQDKKVLKPDINNKNSILDTNYNIDDVIKVAVEFIRKRNGQWVNFSRLSHHLHETFTDLNPKKLGKPNKNYHSLLKLIADHPNAFELRPEPEKQGLYWIRLK